MSLRSILSSLTSYLSGGTTKSNLTLEGFPHKFDIYAPKGEVLHVVVLLHGGSGSKEGIADQFGVTKRGKVEYQTLSKYSVAVVCPQGQACVGGPANEWNPNGADSRTLKAPKGVSTWSNGSMWSGQNDPAFLRALVEKLKKDFPGAKLTLAGHSNGGMMVADIWLNNGDLFDYYGSWCGPLAVKYQYFKAPKTAKPIRFQYGMVDNVIGIDGGVNGSSNHFEDSIWSQQPAYQTAEDVVPPPGRGGWVSGPSFFTQATGTPWSTAYKANYPCDKGSGYKVSYGAVETHVLTYPDHFLSDHQAALGETALTTLMDWVELRG